MQHVETEDCQSIDMKVQSNKTSFLEKWTLQYELGYGAVDSSSHTRSAAGSEEKPGL